MNTLSPRLTTAYQIRIRGAVQGVGFRPHVYGVAQALNMKGWVRNDSQGVLIHAEGVSDHEVLRALRLELPPMASIDDISVIPVAAKNLASFEIITSQSQTAAATRIPADMAPCEACTAEMLDPRNPRYLYAFTNCTHCGPRYTITKAVPYDRAQTSMAAFAMCDPCQSEYETPTDRRFHAQPNACPTCGPQYDVDLADVAKTLIEGGCVALKGVGGFHLMADARNPQAVEKLRQIKQRDAKPFAVMVRSLSAAGDLAHVSEAEQQALQDRRRPIVLCQARLDNVLAPAVSNDLNTLGIMLPSSPAHVVLFEHLRQAGQGQMVLVATSANVNGLPLIIDNTAAEAAFGDHADVVASHNRDILTRVDDSIVRVIDGAPRLLRRARGWVPDPIKLPFDGPPVLALGAELKNTICITRGDEAFVSQHLGGQTNTESQAFQAETIAHMLEVLDVMPEVIVTDMHPDMNATTLKQFPYTPVVRVQHHHAHLASVVAEHHIAEPILGLALDGFGLAPDLKTPWGGEAMVLDGITARRVAGLQALPLPGGDAAARDAWRMALSLLGSAGFTEDHRVQHLEGAELVMAMMARNINCPKTSSAGRLFDGVAALLDVQDVNRFEGEAAMRLEALVTEPVIHPKGWEILPDGSLSLLPLIPDLASATPQDGANIFHGTCAEALVTWAVFHARAQGTGTYIALSGGCFQNRILTERVMAGLRRAGYEPLINQGVPANDGGLSLGQAYLAAHPLLPSHMKTGGGHVSCITC